MKHAFIVFAIISFFLSACNNTQNNHDTAKKNAAINNQKMRDFYDKVMNAHNPLMIDSFISPGYIEHQTDAMYPNTVEGLKARFKDLFTAYPDFHVNVNFVFSHADTVVAETTISGTNSGPMMGMPPTNKQLHIDDIDVVRIVDGKAVEHWGFAEEMKMMQQLGLMPAQGAMADTSKKM
jgi:predicted ester cyclase